MLSSSEVASFALSLPGAIEKDHFGSRSFRVDGKIFAQIGAPPDRALVKITSANQLALNAADPETFQPAPSWGRYGWTYVVLARTNKRQLHTLLRESYDLIKAGGRRARR